VDNTKSTASEAEHSEAARTGFASKHVWRFLCVLLPSCAECGTQDADYFVRVPPGDLTYCADDELCSSCAGDHGVL
jgi:hypothetical protein